MIELKRATYKAMKYACLHFHYAKAIPQAPIGYNVYEDNEWCGCVLFARGASPVLGKSFGLNQGEYVELVRVALNGKQTYTSQVVSAALKELKKESPTVKMVFSYADENQQHLGIIYQATNWLYVGEGGDMRLIYVNGKLTHNKTLNNECKRRGLVLSEDNWKILHPDIIIKPAKPKHKYLYFFDKRLKRKFEYLKIPYPKNEGWTKIDRSIYKRKEEQNAK